MAKSKYVYVMKQSGKGNLQRWYFTSMKKAKKFAETYLHVSGYTDKVRHEGGGYHAFVTANKENSTQWRMYFITREWLG